MWKCFMISSMIPLGKNHSLNIPRRYKVLVEITNKISVDKWLPYNLPVEQPDLRQMKQFWGHCCIYFLSQAETHSYAEREEVIDVSQLWPTELMKGLWCYQKYWVRPSWLTHTNVAMFILFKNHECRYHFKNYLGTTEKICLNPEFLRELSDLRTLGTHLV